MILLLLQKTENHDWQTLKPLIFGKIIDYYNSNQELLIKIEDDLKNNKSNFKEPKQEDNKAVKQIKDLLDSRVRPAVAMDGGDIIFQSYEDGIVYLKMQGSCSGCPSSTATLKMGIENMLKHYLPEVKEVRQVDA